MAYAQNRRLNTVEEQSDGRALEEVLDKCITLILSRTRPDSDYGVLTARKDAAANESKPASSAQEPDSEANDAAESDVIVRESAIDAVDEDDEDE